MQPRKSRAPSAPPSHALLRFRKARPAISRVASTLRQVFRRSEEHTSELQSRLHLVCRLLLEKKKKDHARCIHFFVQIPENIVFLTRAVPYHYRHVLERLVHQYHSAWERSSYEMAGISLRALR